MIAKVTFLIAVIGGVICMASAAKSDLKWQHAVNSVAELDKAVKDGSIKLVEGDVIIGTVGPDTTTTTTKEPTTTTKEPTTTTKEPTTTTKEPTTTTKEPTTTTTTTVPPPPLAPKPLAGEEPIMGHDTDKPTSDISLATFLTTIVTKKAGLGVKLDFKTPEALQQGAPIVIAQALDGEKKLTGSLFINADIVKGPADSADANIKADEFFTQAQTINDAANNTAILSLGWTTPKDAVVNSSIKYEADQVKAMTDAITAALNDDQTITNSTVITLAVRAGIAAQSLDELKKLLTDLPAGLTKPTLTIWIGAGDKNVDFTKLKQVIDAYGGLDSVYLDLPDDDKKSITGGAGALVYSKLAIVLCTLVAVTLQYLH